MSRPREAAGLDPLNSGLEDSTILSFRLPKSIVKRLDRYVLDRQNDMPGLTRADVLRLFLVQGLNAAQAASQELKGK